jgi:hypothetical protein
MTARALLSLPAAIAILAALPAPSSADGLPGEAVNANPVHAPGGEVEYRASNARRHTVVREQQVGGGRTLRRLRLSGRFTVPAVAYDGSPSGLSADARTLVLINPRSNWPRKHTTFAVVDARHMRLRRHIDLRGDFSFDAISPDGRIVYLIQYLSPRDQTKYAVRAYDMHARRFFRAPVVDPSEPDEDMSGIPVTRVSDEQGRWAYTLYDGRKHPFVHALDTERRTAVCIDLDDVHSLAGVHLELGGDRLSVANAARPLAVIDTTTHRLIPVPEPNKPQASTARDEAGMSWLPIAAPTAAILLLAAVGRRRRAATRAAAP